MSVSRHLAYALIACLSLAGVVAALLVTRGGVGLDDDAVYYVSAAQNFVAAGGLATPFGAPDARPLTHYAPGFPFALGLLGFMGISPLSAARWVNACFFGANIWLVACIVFRATRRSGLALWAAFLMLTSTGMLAVHSRAWSEPMFLFLLLFVLWLLAQSLDTDRWDLLMAASFLAMLALLVRYAGVSLVITGLAATVLWAPGDLRRKAKRCAAFVSFPALAVGVISARNAGSSGVLADRRILLHPIEAARLRALVDHLSAWLLPDIAPFLIRVSVLCLFVAACCVIARGHVVERAYTLLETTLALFAVCYLATLFLSIALVDVAIQFSYRILSPAFVACLILVILRVAEWKPFPAAWIGAAARVVLLGLASVCVARAGYWIKRANETGLGFASPRWTRSGIVQSIKAMDVRRPIYTNAAAALYILTGKHVLDIPRKIAFTSGAPRPGYESEILEMKRQLEARDGVVVYLNVYGDLSRDFGMKPVVSWPSIDELQAQIPLDKVQQSADGAIYEMDR